MVNVETWLPSNTIRSQCCHEVVEHTDHCVSLCSSMEDNGLVWSHDSAEVYWHICWVLVAILAQE